MNLINLIIYINFFKELILIGILISLVVGLAMLLIGCYLTSREISRVNAGK